MGGLTASNNRFAAVALAIAVATASGCASGRELVNPTPTPEVAVTRPRSSAGAESTYADGMYTATGQYGSLPSSITVTVTLVTGVISAVEVTPQATDPTSLELQRRFAAAVPAVVVGKPIDEVHIDRLAGSSGTPQGFTAAIQRIKEQAAAARG